MVAKKNTPLGLSPILILGAGRSGTKLLRSILDTAVNTISFPKEINYIWRYGNASYPTDELQKKHARPEVIAYIRNRFRRLSEINDGKRVVEKTCANSLRVDFVNKVFPEAVIIHLVRDGRAVAESARRRWKASPNLEYLIEKFRWVPVQSMPYYFFRYIGYQLGRLLSEHDAKGSWGPRFEGIDKLVKEKSLIGVCGLQWKACVQSAAAGFAKLSKTQTATIKYEDLVRNPIDVIRNLFDEVDVDFNAETEKFIKENVETTHINKWKKSLDQGDLDRLLPHIREELKKWGYLP